MIIPRNHLIFFITDKVQNLEKCYFLAHSSQDANITQDRSHATVPPGARRCPLWGRKWLLHESGDSSSSRLRRRARGGRGGARPSPSHLSAPPSATRGRAGLALRPWLPGGPALQPLRPPSRRGWDPEATGRLARGRPHLDLPRCPAVARRKTNEVTQTQA